MRGPVGRLIPAEPLIAEIRRYIIAHNAEHDDSGAQAFARVSGCSVRQVERILNREQSHVGLCLADRIAIALGSHLDLIYDDELVVA